jgi:hypothetical protein
MNTEVERYLQQVNRWLVPGRRARTLTHIREDLEEFLSQSDDATPLAQRLRAFGHPPVVAARYADAPHVIPGMLAPAYLVVLCVSIVGLVLVNISLMVPTAINGASFSENLMHVFDRAMRVLPWTFTIVTIVFALMGYWVQRQPTK